MKHITRMITWLLAISMLACSMVACNTKKDGASSVSQTNGLDDVIGEAEWYLPEEKNYEGYEYKMLVNTNESNGLPLYGVKEGDNEGDAISVSLYDRALLMEGEYGVDIQVLVDAQFEDSIAMAGYAGLYICDVSMIPARRIFSLAMQGYFCNFLELDQYMNLEASYWDQRIQDDYRIGDMLFTLDGDFTYYDELRTLIVVYNETVYKNYLYENTYGTPYSMVENHTWTYSNMMEMIKALSGDTSGDGEMNELDTWGMISELTATYYFFLGSGLKIMDNDSGELTLTIEDPTMYRQIYDVIEETMTLAENQDILMPNDGRTLSDRSDIWGTANKILKDNRALFRTTTMTDVLGLQDMESNFGILPIPAFFENQTEYHCWVSGNTETPMALYRYVPNVQITAEITERLCYHSRYSGNSLYSAFFDRMKYSRICRTEEDVKMLDLIIDSKAYDIDQATQITGLEATMYRLARDQKIDTLSSSMENIKSAANEKFVKYFTKLIENNKK